MKLHQQDHAQERVWLSSPNLMPEVRAHVSKVGVESGCTHTLRASANYVYIPNTHMYSSSYNSPVSHMDNHQQ